MNPITAVLLLVSVVDGGSAALPPPATAIGAPPAESEPLAALLMRIDALDRRRDEPAAWAEEQKLSAAALARAPNDYGALWRAARVYFWLSDDSGVAADQRSRWGKEGWDLAEKAITINAGDVAGHYFAAVCMGNYALGLGMMRALSQGLEGKFKERLKRAGELDPRYQHGSISIAWGRFYDKLPWPKRDRKKAQQHERDAMQINPHSLRARVFLAQSLMDDGKAAEAKPLLDEVLAAPVGRYDTPEEHRAKLLGASAMADLKKKLKFK